MLIAVTYGLLNVGFDGCWKFKRGAAKLFERPKSGCCELERLKVIAGG